MELTLEGMERRVLELRQAEGMAWVQLHAVQGRLMEAEHLLGLLQGKVTEDGTLTEKGLEAILPPGDRVDGFEPVSVGDNHVAGLE